MKQNQLWYTTPDVGLMLDVLKCFNLTGLDDRSQNCRCSVIAYNTPQRLWDLRHRLQQHYKPNRYRIYFAEPLRTERCITILRQVLRVHGHHLETREGRCPKRTRGKDRFFCVWPDGMDPRQFNCKPAENIVTFD